MPEAIAREAGFRWPVAVTRAVWANAIEVPEGTEGLQDEAGRLWDVLWMAVHAIRRQVPRHPSEAPNQLAELDVLVWTRRGGPLRVRTLRMWAIAGPGDAGEPVITVMFPEDY